MNAEPAFGDDTPLTLKEACSVFFRNTIRPATLRSEAARGALTIMRIGRTDFVTPAGIRAMMVSKCLANDSPRASTSETMSRHGSSETERGKSAQAAALTTAQALKKLSPNTSPRNSARLSAKAAPLA